MMLLKDFNRPSRVVTPNANANVMSLFFLLSAIWTSYAYTSPGLLPASKQHRMLKEMTNVLCDVKIGELSQVQLNQAPELMQAWATTRVSSKEGAMAVESLIKRLIDERRSGNPQVSDLTVQDYNYLLEGWARSREGTAAAERCEGILVQMQDQGLKPDLSSFKSCIMAWKQAQAHVFATSGRGTSTVDYIPHRAQRILEWMIRLYSASDNERALPDADCFNSVLQIWSRSGHPEATTQTEHLLGVMSQLYAKTLSSKVKPSTTSFNAVLSAWTHTKDRNAAAKRVDKILSFMERMKDENGDASLAPDRASYNTAITTVCRLDDRLHAARMANHFVRRMETAYRADPTNPRMHPDSILFNSAMGCWGKVPNYTKAYRKARSILDRQIVLYDVDGCEEAKPDVYGFTSVIACCAAEPGTKDERAKAFNCAYSTYKQLQKSDEEPNHVSYGSMLKACAKLLPNGPLRKKYARRVFMKCCEDGCVGDMALSRLREASPEIYKEFIRGDINRRNLPSEWTMNVHENNFRRKRTIPQRKRREV